MKNRDQSVSLQLLFATAPLLSLGVYLLPAIFKTDKRTTTARQVWSSPGSMPSCFPILRPKEGEGCVEFGLARPSFEQARKDRKLVFVDFTGVSLHELQG